MAEKKESTPVKIVKKDFKRITFGVARTTKVDKLVLGVRVEMART